MQSIVVYDEMRGLHSRKFGKLKLSGVSFFFFSLSLSLSLCLSVIVASLLPRVDALALHSPVRDLGDDLGSGDGDLTMKYVGLPRVLKRSI